MYNKFIISDNITYSVDMLRLKTYITYSKFSEIEFRFNTIYSEFIKKKWTTARAKDFFYNYQIEIEEGQSFWFGFLHNSEKRSFYDNAEYNFTIEFNPNKLKNHFILLYLLKISSDWFIKSLDLAIDLKINILDLIIDMSRREIKTISHGYDDKTIYLGKGDNRIKIYNKKKESKLDILTDLTRIEISSSYDDYKVSKIDFYSYQNVLPSIYLNNYLYSFKDYEDKTLLAILFAVQNRFSFARFIESL